MYSGTDRNGWNHFWSTRKKPLSITQLSPFYKNFTVMMGIIAKSGNALTRKRPLGRELSSRSVLEVGAGRGTLSELFRQKGFRTFATDLENRLTYPDHIFVKNDILENLPFGSDRFDITFTYGLLEHFKWDDKLTIIRRCLDMTKGGGVSIHYVVPKKLTNIREDRSVYRDNCLDLTKNFDSHNFGSDFCSGGIKHVFPAWGNGWECSEFKSKGFVMWFTKYTKLDKFMQEEMMKNIENNMLAHNKMMREWGL